MDLNKQVVSTRLKLTRSLFWIFFGAFLVFLAKVINIYNFVTKKRSLSKDKSPNYQKSLRYVDILSSESLRHAACSRNSETLLNAKALRTEIENSGLSGQGLRPRALKYQQPLRDFIKHCQKLPYRSIPNLNLHTPIDVSIIIPVFNQWHLTRACLNSIIATTDNSINYEIILADDCSSDKTIFARDYYPGLIVVKPLRNLGFLRNCNHAAKKARGRYLMLLNNDTIVLPNWLSSLYQTLEEDNSAAIVGSKILYATGKIQEAGAVLFRDGTDIHIGRGSHRDTAIFNIQRETDVVSGCSLLIRKSFWDEVGGFDERYKNAYFEDYDLAMLARFRGMRVIYQPKSELVHFEHKTYSTMIKKNHIKLSNQNKVLFLDKWHEQLNNQHQLKLSWHVAMSHAERTPLVSVAQRRVTKKLNILFYSPNPIYPNKHGNRTRMQSLIRKFHQMGHKVHVVLLDNPETSEENEQITRELFNVTVDVLPFKKLKLSPGFVPFDAWYEKGMGESIRCLCDKYDIDMVFCSYVYQSKLLEYVPKHILKVIDTHDIMGNRAEMLRLNKLPVGQFSCSIAEEASYILRSDIVVGITEQEARYFEMISGHKNVVMISHIEEPKFVNKHFVNLCQVGIVASNNRFNLSMLQKFLCIINQRLLGSVDNSSSEARRPAACPRDPEILLNAQHYCTELDRSGSREQVAGRRDMNCQQTLDIDVPPFTINIIGDIKKGVDRRFAKRKMHVFKKPWIKMHGFVPDIAQIYAQMDVMVSPMMCGTGINIKTVEALAYGVPLLTTSFGSRGITTHDKMHQHLTLESLVDSLFNLQNKPQELKRLSTLSRNTFLDFSEKNRAGLDAIFH